ncbi:hypothetical protein [Neisseria dumasiana]|uniref:HNH endonuclease n=1 Tax=Neisseria dumasiana TaxID=1931275 RepID=A0ABX3WN05_9NEIS|nr:hypothetical protein [Neisseria dumasiana]OSI36114.1 hypothetical protein BV913_02855 [Neisseria dumasiana]UOO83520.1 hypothetical protein LVJ88_07305 [Neisseria dumasiana]
MSEYQICARCDKSLPLHCFDEYQTSADKKEGTWRARKTCRECIKYVSLNHRKRKAAEEKQELAISAEERKALCLQNWGWLYKRWAI